MFPGVKARAAEFRDSLLKSLEGAKKVFVVAHKGLDDDAAGSIIAVHRYLESRLGRGVCVRMLVSGGKPERYSCFKGYEGVEAVRDIASHIKDGFVVFLDGSSWGRFSGEEKPSIKFSACIDHHSSEIDDYDLSLVVPGFSSTAELVYHAFYAGEPSISKEVCEALLLGILGDTGNFSYTKGSMSSVFLVAERLVREGDINIQEMQARYGFVTKESFRVFSRIVNNAEIRRVGNWPTAIFSYLDNGFSSDYVAIDEAAHMFTEYTRKVRGVAWGFVVTPRGDYCSVSLRSLPSGVNVRRIAEAFGGGGHDLAAGCGLKMSDCVSARQAVIDWLENNRS